MIWKMDEEQAKALKMFSIWKLFQKAFWNFLNFANFLRTFVNFLPTFNWTSTAKTFRLGRRDQNQRVDLLALAAEPGSRSRPADARERLAADAWKACWCEI